MSRNDTRSLLAVVGLALLHAGCEEDSCDPGQQIVDNVCVASTAAADASAADAAVADAQTTDGGAFGSPCKVDGDCAAPMDTCALPPGEDPFCTRKGCDTMPAICPSSWQCMDLSAFIPGLHICAPPS